MANLTLDHIKTIVQSVLASATRYKPNLSVTDPDDPRYVVGAEGMANKVTTAQTTADNAQTTADNAQTTADNAQTTADNAQTTADNAQTTADNAQTTADNARSAVDNLDFWNLNGNPWAIFIQNVNNSAWLPKIVEDVVIFENISVGNVTVTWPRASQLIVPNREYTLTVDGKDYTVTSSKYGEISTMGIIIAANLSYSVIPYLNCSSDWSYKRTISLVGPSYSEDYAFYPLPIYARKDVITLESSTYGSNKRFHITVDDDGNLTTTAVAE